MIEKFQKFQILENVQQAKAYLKTNKIAHKDKFYEIMAEIFPESVETNESLKYLSLYRNFKVK